MPENRTLPLPVQSRGPQAIEPKPNRAYRNPARVPSVVPCTRRTEALQSVRAGRSLHQAAAGVPCSTLVVIEEWLRSIDRQLAEIRTEMRGKWAA